jgi:NAD-dependent dihydropyrimidine dehydrogenase PreA subunit
LGDATEQQVDKTSQTAGQNAASLSCMPETQDCKGPGRLVPIVDASRCEAKEDCVRVCPYDVFSVRKLTDGERSSLGLLARFKVFVHGGKQAFVTRPDDCHGCGLCVAACPEKAIKLRAL